MESLGRYGTLPIEGRGDDDCIAGCPTALEEEGSELDKRSPRRSLFPTRELG